MSEFLLVMALAATLFLVWASSARKNIQAEREAANEEVARVRNAIQSDLVAHRQRMELLKKESQKQRRKSEMDFANARRMQRESDEIIKSFCGIDMARPMGGRRGFYFGQHHPGDHSFSDLMKRLNDDSSL